MWFIMLAIQCCGGRDRWLGGTSCPASLASRTHITCAQALLIMATSLWYSIAFASIFCSRFSFQEGKECTSTSSVIVREWNNRLANSLGIHVSGRSLDTSLPPRVTRVWEWIWLYVWWQMPKACSMQSWKFSLLRESTPPSPCEFPLVKFRHCRSGQTRHLLPSLLLVISERDLVSEESCFLFLEPRRPGKHVMLK